MLKIGWASRDITPQRPAMLQGQMHARIAEEAADPITVTALALTGGDPGDAAVFISLDMAYVSSEMLRSVRARLAKTAPSLPGGKVIMHATHTHTSLVVEDGFYEHPGGDVMMPAQCSDLVVEQAAAAAAEAWESRTARTMASAFGHAVVGHNRYAVYADGHAEMYGKTNRDDFRHIGGYEDHSLDMLFTWDADGTLAGLALAIPCPSQVDEHEESFSADFWHDIRQELRARLGESLAVLPICSAAGDQSPHFLLYNRQEKEMRMRRGISERREIALRVADAVERALACTGPGDVEDAPFVHMVKQIELAPWSIQRGERDWAEAERACWIAEGGDSTSWWPERLREVVETFDGSLPQEPLPVELHILRIGDVVIATNPFELFLDYGLQIKAKSPAAQTVLIQIAGKGWYLPTERAVKGGSYGAMPAVSVVGPEGGSELVEETLESIRDLFDD
ncbi:MAG: hypothetical protein ACYTAN_14065 [Planctomycetota bacterium]|jgi:hypothetical protein